jgi:flagellar biosynthetic protein FliQ
MTDTQVLEIATKTIMITFKIAAPFLAVTLGVGLFISLIQAATQVQEVTLTFVPKLAAVAIVIVVAGNWMLSEMVGFTHELFALLPRLISS